MEERQQIVFDNHSIYSGEPIVHAGWSRDVVGVPNSGRMKFETIGNLADREHKDAKNIDLSDQRFLNLINKYDADKNIDPDMWRGAVWGNGKKVRAGDPALEPPQPDEMDFAVANDYGGDHAAYWDDKEEAYFLQCQTRSGENYNWEQNCASYLVNYVGRFPAGTKLAMSFEHRAKNQDRYGDGSVVWCRGWRDGYYQGGDYHDYVKKTYGPRDYGFKSYTSPMFVVLASHPDVWVAFEVQDNDPRYEPNTYNRALIRNWKIKLFA